ncbi:MAG: Stp1/IreP family PP2C-type Ser/Thr phosphatase [Eubacterium sp.]|nr:Stp1/IreP family PP2C-type Ser/Thr phosphatase [Eubacterium sp.]
MKSFSGTDAGKVRRVNQDYIYTGDEPVGNLPNLFVVADGMGGHKAGDYASRYAVDRVIELAAQSADEDIDKIVTDALVQVNKELIEEAMCDPDKEGMGTTFVAAVIDGDVLHAFNVGDSRLYLVNHAIRQVTRDHSYVQEMVKNGRLNKKQARNHPRKNVITRAVGVSPELEVDVFTEKLNKGDEVLLCSDGLTNMVEDTLIEQIIKAGTDLVDEVTRLIAAANENGGIDNISVVLIRPF